MLFLQQLLDRPENMVYNERAFGEHMFEIYKELTQDGQKRKDQSA